MSDVARHAPRGGIEDPGPTVTFAGVEEVEGRAEGSSSKAAHQSAPPMTSSYITQLNAKLVACGAAKHSLKLDGLSERHRDNVVKVLYDLLAQREEDLSHLESLSTAHKVIVYDHERLCVQHKALKTRVVVAEKAKEGAKAQLSGLTQRLKNEQELHKLSKSETQKARTALNFVRTQAQYESKKREVQLERTMQNWQKLSTDNARMLASNWHTGVLVLNPIDPVVQAPRTDSFWDPSINDLNKTIESLQEECEAFRHVTLATANQLAALLAFVNGEPEPERLDSSAFFTQSTSMHGLSSSLTRSNMATNQAQVQVSSSISHPNNAHGRLREMLSRLRERAEMEMAHKEGALGQSTAGLGQSTAMVDLFEGDLELERAERARVALEEKATALERDLAESRELVEEGRKMFAAFATTQLEKAERQASQRAEEASKRAEDEAADLIRALREQLEQERQENEAAAGKVELERAALENQRAAFAEEKRQKDLEELLIGPPAHSSPVITPAPPTSTSSSLSPRSRHLLTSRAHPLISSPLRSTGSSSEHGVQRTPPAAARRRSRKGPATPLARFVTHKLVAEKIASVKALRTVKGGPSREEQDTSAGGTTSSTASEWSTTHSEEEPALRPSGKGNRQRDPPVSSSASSTVKPMKTLHSSATARSRTGGATASTAASLSRSQSRAPASAGLGASLLASGQPRPANLFKASGIGPDAAARKRAGR